MLTSLPPCRPRILTLALSAALWAGTALAAAPATTPAHAGSSSQSAQAAQTAHKGSFAMVAHLAVDGVAEIVAATPDGMTLLYTSADLGRLGQPLAAATPDA